MPGTQKSRKPAEQLRRRNAPEQWAILPAAGCKEPAPAWPMSKASADELALWKSLWASPVACWWREQAIQPFVVARYVRMVVEKPSSSGASRSEADLGLTPAGMARLRIVVERPEPAATKRAGRYDHLKAVD